MWLVILYKWWPAVTASEYECYCVLYSIVCTETKTMDRCYICSTTYICMAVPISTTKMVQVLQTCSCLKQEIRCSCMFCSATCDVHSVMGGLRGGGEVQAFCDSSLTGFLGERRKAAAPPPLCLTREHAIVGTLLCSIWGAVYVLPPLVRWFLALQSAKALVVLQITAWII